MLTINLTVPSVPSGHTECRQESAFPGRMRQFQLLESALLCEPPLYAAVNSRDKRGGKVSTDATIEPFPSS